MNSCCSYCLHTFTSSLIMNWFAIFLLSVFWTIFKSCCYFTFHTFMSYFSEEVINSMKARNIVTSLYATWPCLHHVIPLPVSFPGFTSLLQVFFYINSPGFSSWDLVLFHIYWCLPIAQKLIFFNTSECKVEPIGAIWLLLFPVMKIFPIFLSVYLLTTYL